MLAPGVDERSLPLSAAEGFLVSRMDGETGLAELADSTGTPIEVVQGLLAKLEVAGALSWTSAEPPRPSSPPESNGVSTAGFHGPTSPPPPPPSDPSARGPSSRHRVVTKRASVRPSPRPSATPSSSTRPSSSRGSDRAGAQPTSSRPPQSGSRTNRSGDDRTLGPGGWDPALLEEASDLPEERRREILDLYFSVDLYNHYEMLQVGYDAERKEIKKAYFALSKRFHPDAFYGKELGSFKARMEVVFKRLTEAHKVLTHKTQRGEYDDYLDVKRATQKLQSGVDAGRQAAKDLHDSVDSGGPSSGMSVRPSAAVARPSEEPAGPRATPQPSAPPRQRLSEDEKRRLARELMARRMQGATGRRSTLSARRPDAAPPPKTAEERREEARLGLARTLRRTAEVSGLGTRVERYIAAAEQSAANDDMVAATNQLRLALALDEKNEKAKVLFEKYWTVLGAALADQYERQARYEEGHGDLEAAVISWQRVIEGRPDDFKALNHTAGLMLTLDMDLKVARTHAVRAVELNPRSSAARLNLGKIYLAAGMPSSAKKELEEAAKPDPSSEIVKNLLRELR